MFGKGQIGWRAESLNAYVICMFIRSLENTLRMVNGAKRSQLEMPKFEELFCGKSSNKNKDIFGAFIDQVDANEDNK